MTAHRVAGAGVGMEGWSGLIHQWKRGRGLSLSSAHGESGARRNWCLPLVLASSSSLHFLSPGRKGRISGTMGVQEGCMEEVTPEGKFNLLSASPTRISSLASSVVLSPQGHPDLHLSVTCPGWGDPGVYSAVYFPVCAPSFIYLTSIRHLHVPGTGGSAVNEMASLYRPSWSWLLVEEE